MSDDQRPAGELVCGMREIAYPNPANASLANAAASLATTLPGERCSAPASGSSATRDRPRSARGWVPCSAAAALGLDESARRAHNAAFECDELARFAGFFAKALPQPLNAEQRAAIVVDEDATLVVAAAGSGKTTLLLGKIAYLVARGLARPEEIALLAFNNSVRAEIRERLAGSHPGVAVHTFHSLGLQIVRDATSGGCRLSALAADGAGLQRLFAETLPDLAAREPEAVADWLAAQFRMQRDRTDFASQREHRVWARRRPPLTLCGERASSEPLREVADRLTLAGIRYRSGAGFALLPVLPAYLPDLHLPEARVVIDLAGADPASQRDWRGAVGVMAREVLARLVCIRYRLRRLRIGRAARRQRDGTLVDALADGLARFGLDLRPCAVGVVAGTPAGRARLDDTAALLATCVALRKSAGAGEGSASAGEQEDAAGGRGADPLDERDQRRARTFDVLFHHALDRYEAQLAARGEIDFNDMIGRAVTALDGGAATLPFRYLLVDEFQDISAGRAELVKALRRARPGLKLVAVGDDWQSIYRFAGSDVSIMTGFEAHFGPAETRFLRQTFRFDRRLEAVASAFVLRNPAQIRKQVEAREPTTDAPSVVLWLPADADAEDPMPGIAAHLFGAPGSPTEGQPATRPDILILGRYRALERQARLEWLAEHYPQADWRYSTIHRAKGATADFAVILGVSGGRQPFPVERGEDPLLGRFLGVGEDFPHAEERRLFYVALTRARHRVYVVGDRRQPSPFFEELLADGRCVAVLGGGSAQSAGPAQPGLG